MAVSNDLESLMARVQDASRRQAAAEAQQKQQAQQAQQAQQQQGGAGGAGGAQGAGAGGACGPDQAQQQQQQAPSMDQVNARNDDAGQKWGNFQAVNQAGNADANSGGASDADRQKLYAEQNGQNDQNGLDRQSEANAQRTAAEQNGQGDQNGLDRQSEANRTQNAQTQAALHQDPFAGADKVVADEQQRRAIAQDPFAGADKAVADEQQRRATTAAQQNGQTDQNGLDRQSEANRARQQAQTPAQAPAAQTPAAAPKTGMAKTLADNPNIKSNQDLVNHYYKNGGGTWEGASKKASEDGASLNKLIRDRQGKPDASTATPPASTPATTTPATTPATTTPATTTPAATTPETQGVNRSIRPFREVDQKKLEDALPANAKHLAKTFIDEGRKNNIDPVALAAISKHETGNFTSSAFKNKNNAMGISDARGPTMQKSAEESIGKMARGLANPNGYYKGKNTIGEIANTYAPVGAGNDPGGLNNGWGKGVAKFADDLASKVRPTSTSTTPATTTPATTPATTPPPSNTTPATTPATTTPATAQTNAPAANTPRAGDPPNGTATTDRTAKTGQRNQMTSGRVTVNGRTYQYNSGGSGNGNLPPGPYTVSAFKNTTNQAGMVRDGVGFSFKMTQPGHADGATDSRTGRERSLLRIHPDGGNAGTLGCMGIVGDAATLRQFRDDMNAELRRNGGRFTLNVQ